MDLYWIYSTGIYTQDTLAITTKDPSAQLKPKDSNITEKKINTNGHNANIELAHNYM